MTSAAEAKAEAKAYVEQHGLEQTLSKHVNELLQAKPSDPRAFLSTALGGAAASALPARPVGALGSFLRVIAINDVYKLDNYPRVATAVGAANAGAAGAGCVAISCLAGDFLSPCILTALDGGSAMADALNYARIDYCCLGNKEFDLPLRSLAQQLGRYTHGQVLNSNVTNPELSHLPRYATVKVGQRTAVLAGLLTPDPSKYRPANTPTATPLADAARAVWDEAKGALGGGGAEGAPPPDLFLPMTHQNTKDDRALAAALAKHGELGARTPVLLGGHDHDVFIETAGSSLIVKTGADAEHIAVVDVYWTAGGALRRRVTLLPADEFEEEPRAAAFVARRAFLSESVSVPLATLPAPLSSQRVRFQTAGQVGGFLCDLLKAAMRADRQPVQPAR